VLLLANETNYLIRYLLTLFGLAPREAAAGKAGEADADATRETYNAGRLIGILERILIFFFVTEQEYTAIAFIIAAKGFARFKEMDQREFAEYVLIGTLLSVLLALVIAIPVRRMLG
jgi:hypothetical protein